MVGFLAWPAAGLAQVGGVLPPPTVSASTVTGQATAAQVVLLGLLGTATTTSLASTGISGTNSESDVAQVTGSIPSLGGDTELHKPNPSTTGPSVAPNEITACGRADSRLGT